MIIYRFFKWLFCWHVEEEKVKEKDALEEMWNGMAKPEKNFHTYIHQLIMSHPNNPTVIALKELSISYSYYVKDMRGFYKQMEKNLSDSELKVLDLESRYSAAAIKSEDNRKAAEDAEKALDRHTNQSEHQIKTATGGMEQEVRRLKSAIAAMQENDEQDSMRAKFKL